MLATRAATQLFRAATSTGLVARSTFAVAPRYYASVTKYTKEHEWITYDDADPKAATIGVTDHAQDSLGDIVYLELPEVGDAVEKDESYGILESVKATSDCYSPVSGTVTDINQTVVDEPSLVNQDPEGASWMIKVDLSDVSELDDLMDRAAYDQLVQEEKDNL